MGARQRGRDIVGRQPVWWWWRWWLRTRSSCRCLGGEKRRAGEGGGCAIGDRAAADRAGGGGCRLWVDSFSFALTGGGFRERRDRNDRRDNAVKRLETSADRLRTTSGCGVIQRRFLCLVEEGDEAAAGHFFSVSADEGVGKTQEEAQNNGPGGQQISTGGNVTGSRSCLCRRTSWPSGHGRGVRKGRVGQGGAP